MGGATTQALAATSAALDASTSVDLGTARDLFAASRALGDAPQLSGALADWAAAPAARSKVVADVFGSSLGAEATRLLTEVVAHRWSSPDDLVAGVEALAIRAASASDPSADVEGDLFRFARTVAANPELELALGSRLGDQRAKGALVESLLKGKVSEPALVIASSIVQQPRERRVRRLLTIAQDAVAAQRGRTVATVVSAMPLSEVQTDRLAAVLSERYGKAVTINPVVDPAVIGGLRVQIADDVIDASVASRMADLRHRLAG